MIPTILLVEDSEDDVYLMTHAVQEAKIICTWRVVKDGGAAIDYLAGSGEYLNRALFPLPQVILLDLKLPEASGFEVLQWLRCKSEYDQVAVIVLTSSSNPIDFNRAIRLGANSMLSKPPDFTQLVGLLRTFRIFHGASLTDA